MFSYRFACIHGVHMCIQVHVCIYGCRGYIGCHTCALSRLNPQLTTSQFTLGTPGLWLPHAAIIGRPPNSQLPFMVEGRALSPYYSTLEATWAFHGISLA